MWWILDRWMEVGLFGHMRGRDFGGSRCAWVVAWYFISISLVRGGLGCHGAVLQRRGSELLGIMSLLLGSSEETRDVEDWSAEELPVGVDVMSWSQFVSGFPCFVVPFSSLPWLIRGVLHNTWPGQIHACAPKHWTRSMGDGLQSSDDFHLILVFRRLPSHPEVQTTSISSCCEKHIATSVPRDIDSLCKGRRRVVI